MNLSYIGGCAKTADAMHKATEHFDLLGRSIFGSKHILVVITNGKSNRHIEASVREAILKGMQSVFASH